MPEPPGKPPAFAPCFDAGAVRCPAGYCAAMPDRGSKGATRPNSEAPPSDGASAGWVRTRPIRSGAFRQACREAGHLRLRQAKQYLRCHTCLGGSAGESGRTAAFPEGFSNPTGLRVTAGLRQLKAIACRPTDQHRAEPFWCDPRHLSRTRGATMAR